MHLFYTILAAILSFGIGFVIGRLIAREKLAEKIWNGIAKAAEIKKDK